MVVSLISRLESNKEEGETESSTFILTQEAWMHDRRIECHILRSPGEVKINSLRKIPPNVADSQEKY